MSPLKWGVCVGGQGKGGLKNDGSGKGNMIEVAEVSVGLGFPW